MSNERGTPAAPDATRPPPEDRPFPGRSDITSGAVGRDLHPCASVGDTLALPLLAATEAAAVGCVAWIGRGDAKAADGAAVAAMRDALAAVPGRGRVAIGEGEKDEAPMLYAGEEIGTGVGSAFDLAVDPLEGTRYCAQGLDGAISVVAAARPGALWATGGWYMEKLVVGRQAAGSIALDAPIEENLARVAAALGKRTGELVVAVQDRPRHSELLAAVRDAGAAVVQFADGDVMASLRALLPEGDVDVLVGVGGAPEGVITACAVRLLGGDMQARAAPQSAEERYRLESSGADPERLLLLDDLVADPDCCFVATGVTGGSLLDRPRPGPGGWHTWSLLATPSHPGLLVRGRVPAPLDGRA